jgi:effector-binding domain-containing protein
VPTNSKIISNEPGILTGQLKSFRTVKTVLKGNYDNLKEAWDTTMKYISDNNLEMIEGGPMLETYLTDPMSQPNPAKWITEIYVAIK